MSLSLALQRKHLFCFVQEVRCKTSLHMLTISSKTQIAPLLHSTNGCALNPVSLETKYEFSYISHVNAIF